MDVPRLRLEVRVILVSYRAALKKAHPDEVVALRARAHGLLDEVRARADSPEDGELLSGADAELDQRQPSR
jgi:hypothetical protein